MCQGKWVMALPPRNPGRGWTRQSRYKYLMKLQFLKISHGLLDRKSQVGGLRPRPLAGEEFSKMTG